MTAQQLIDQFKAIQIDTFVGVPDSTLAEFTALVDQDSTLTNIIVPNEGSAIAYASGYHVATGKRCCVYLQNSGIGNAINPLLSLAHEDVYDIPMVLLIGWRGYPGIKDEPQHVAQGAMTLDLLHSMGITVHVLGDNTELSDTVDLSEFTEKQFAILVKPGTFKSYEYPIVDSVSPTRREAIKDILSIYPDSLFVCTTGKASRELYELREEFSESHDNDFLMVGSMGHASMFALSLAMNSDRHIVCIDGDGAALMHRGNVDMIVDYIAKGNSNLTYIMLNNGAHDSVGGHAIACSTTLPAAYTETIRTEHMLLNTLIRSNKLMYNIYVSRESNPNLSRPKQTPVEAKQLFMQNFTNENGSDIS